MVSLRLWHLGIIKSLVLTFPNGGTSADMRIRGLASAHSVKKILLIDIRVIRLGHGNMLIFWGGPGLKWSTSPVLCSLLAVQQFPPLLVELGYFALVSLQSSCYAAADKTSICL
jgi:hypothetical protein